MLKKIKQKCFDQQGAIVVEATISLTAFMFFIVTFLTIVNICYAQAKIGVAINQTAKEISQYSYLYELTGLRDGQEKINDKAQDAKHSIDNALDGVTNIFNSVGNISDTATGISVGNLGDSIKSISGDVDSISGDVSSLQSTFEDIADDPKSFALSVAALAGNGVIEEAKSKLIAGPLSKTLCRKHLVKEQCASSSVEKTKCNEFLKKLKIQPKGGSYINGLDFSDSVLFLNGSTDIMVIVHYRIKLIELFDNDITLSFTQCATTRGWVPVSDAADSGSGDDGAGDDGDTEETQPTTVAKKTSSEYVDEFTVSKNSDTYFIGVVSEADKSTANYYSGAYMKIDSSEHTDIKENLGSSGVTQVYKKYVDTAIENNAQIVCPSNPDDAKDPYYRQQIKYLESKGYSFYKNEATGLYVARKD